MANFWNFSKKSPWFFDDLWKGYQIWQFVRIFGYFWRFWVIFQRVMPDNHSFGQKYFIFSFFRWRSQRKANCDGTELHSIQRSIFQRWICFWRRWQHNFLYSRLWLWTPSVDHNFIFSASKTGPAPVFHYFLNVSKAKLVLFVQFQPKWIWWSNTLLVVRF